MIARLRDTRFGYAITQKLDTFSPIFDQWVERNWEILKIAIPVGIVAIIVGILAFLFLTVRNVPVKIDSVRWQRTIEIEQYRIVHDNSWYGHPSDAYNITSCYCYHYTRTYCTYHTEYTTTTDSKGRTSRTSHQVCDRHSESIYDWFYTYDVNRWIFDHPMNTSGDSQRPVYWADNVPSCPSIDIGCMRERKRYSKYTVVSIDNQKEKYWCDYPDDQYNWWSALSITGDFRIDIGQYIHIPRCETFKGI